MSLLLLGGSSFVGAAVRHDPAWPADARWTYRTRPSADPAALPLDLRDGRQIEQTIAELAPTHILDCTWGNDPVEAAAIYHTLCAAFRATTPNVRYVLVSTDAVFSGDAGRLYREDDPPDPPSPYGRAKAAAESILRSALPNAAIARTCLVYGTDWRETPPAPDKRSAATLAALRAGEPVEAYAAQYRTPTDVADLAPALLRLALGEERGIFHLAGPQRLSRADFTRETARAFGLDAGLVVDQPLPANPLFGNDVGLDIAQTQARLGWSPVSPPEGLARLAATFAHAHA
jgi:dTDP-4-dehydrorhamnose reductase